MGKSPAHKRAQSRAAGKGGRTEVKLPNRKILDALSASGKKATEVERSGTQRGLRSAAKRLKGSKASQKVLKVLQKDMSKAAAAMKLERVKGTVKNMGGTKRRSV